jgi:hypothetical protein
VAGQLAQLLAKRGRLRYLPDEDAYVDCQSGEIVVLDARVLVGWLRDL